MLSFRLLDVPGKELIPAIKAVRWASGKNLLEAKQCVDLLGSFLCEPEKRYEAEAELRELGVTFEITTHN